MQGVSKINKLGFLLPSAVCVSTILDVCSQLIFANKPQMLLGLLSFLVLFDQLFEFAGFLSHSLAPIIISQASILSLDFLLVVTMSALKGCFRFTNLLALAFLEGTQI